mgnify:CR=1 FL=1
MILSMTGFGAASTFYENKEIKIEVKSINSKAGDIRFRMPHRYSALEIRLRRIVQEMAHRGKIEVNITTQSDAADDEYEINIPLFKSYYQSLNNVLTDIDAQDANLAAGILKIYNVVRPNNQSIPDTEESALINCMREALDALKVYRLDEGQAMEADFKSNANNISSKIDEIEPHENQRIIDQRNRLKKSFADIGNDIDLDKNRFEQELTYYLEKFDLNEEKVRLKQHCDYFIQTLAKPDEVKGKSLAFISQEMGREINTIGSKANNHHIQHIVVSMKEELEKIKEQLANVI